MITCRQALPASWTDTVRAGEIALGLDLGTTDKKASNPSALVVMEDWQGQLWERLVVTWKTGNEQVTEAMLRLVLDDLRSAGRRARSVVVDATNETFFAQSLKRLFATQCPVHLVKGGEKLRHAGEEMPAKQLLGNLLANAHTDGRINSPAAAWVKDDRRLVRKLNGHFDNTTDSLGQHGDTWDAAKLALWGLRRAGRVTANAVSITPAHQPQRPGLLSRLLGRRLPPSSNA